MTSETKGSSLVQYVAALSGTLAVISDGMHCGWASPSVPQFTNNETCTLCINDEQGSTLAVMPLIGSIFGSILAAVVVDMIGRKATLLTTAIPFFFGWIVVAYCQNIMQLYIARFIAGAAGGMAFTVLPMYIGEIADANVRGMLGSSCSVLWIAGFLLINVIGSYFTIKATAIYSSIVPALLFVTFVWMPESPYFLCMKNKSEEAQRSLERLKGTKCVFTDLTRIRNAIEQEEKSRNGRVLDLFRIPSNRKAAFIIGGLRGFQQLAGTTAIAFYTHEIFSTAGDHITPHYAVIIYYSVQLILTMVSSSIVDKAGRRPLLIISISGAAIALFIEGGYFYILNKTSIDTTSFSVISVVGLILFVIMFGVGMQSIPICMLGELFPTNVKASALSLADIYYCVMATIASKFLQITKTEFGLHVSFLGFAICSIIGLLFIYFYVPETKGKTLEDIQRELKGEVVGRSERSADEEKVSFKT